LNRGVLETSQEYTIDNYPVIAYGYEKQDISEDTPTPLYEKPDGLGIESGSHHEITHGTYVQFDICSLEMDVSVKELGFSLNGSYQLFGSNQLGELGHKLVSSDEKEVWVPHYKKYKFISISGKECVEIKSMCIKREFLPSYGTFYTTTVQDVALGSPIPFTNTTVVDGLIQVDQFTIQSTTKGVYNVQYIVCSIQPNACALYVNGFIVPGSWFGSESQSTTVSQVIITLVSGDKVQLVNQSSQTGSITITPFGSGTNPFVGQNAASLSIWRMY
jgi:hypothetical protein